LKSSSVTGNLVTLDPTEGFLVYFQITLVAAILLSAPWILYQMWRFLEPALTRTERRFSLVLLPFSTLLFFSGCALGYAMAPLFFKFFIAFQPPGTIANFGFSRSIALLAKMVLVFGICFQVPVVTIFLNKIGLISRNFLIEYWRHAVVVIFIVVAVLTPTWDPLSLAVCAVPPCLLYGLSIWMVKWL
jgi:sec-independent protein translocase protein TatC